MQKWYGLLHGKICINIGTKQSSMTEFFGENA